MTKMDVSKLAAIPFLDHAELQGRFLCSLLFYDGKWRAWLDAGDLIIETRMWPAEAVYFGTCAERETDISLHFLDLMAQRLSYLSIDRQHFGFQDDIFNLSASLRKIRHLDETKTNVKDGVSRMVATEVEYVHGVCCSIFDLWQEVLVALWDGIKLLDPKTKKRKLKQSYREMLFSSDELRTVDELVERFGIPLPLAECYLRSADFFSDLRKFRDRVIHQGAAVQVIFEGDDGFLISESRVPFRGMAIWQPEERLPNGLVPLLPALDYVVFRTLATCEDFSRTIERIFQLPAPIAPKFALFVRGYFGDALISALKDAQRREVLQSSL
jgi:hypothetical protein